MTSTRIEDYDPMELTFGVVMQQFESIRHPEDGETMIGEAYYVQAEAPNGVRWWREVGVMDWIEIDGLADAPMIGRTYEPAELAEKASLVATRLENSPTRRLNPDMWAYAGACYGSQAYQALGIEEDAAWLERDAEAWG